MSRLRGFVALILALLRELADEGPYRRHLAMYGLSHSPQAWRTFSDERAKLRYSRAKCC